MSETIDPAAFKALQDTAGADFVVELVDAFFEEAPVMLDALHSARAEADAERFRRTAHSLKSNANTFGAATLAAMAKALELGGLAKAAEMPDPLGALRDEYERVASRLKELCR